jgi:hypothetical protein
MALNAMHAPTITPADFLSFIEFFIPPSSLINKQYIPYFQNVSNYILKGKKTEG